MTPQPFYEDRGSPIAARHVLEALAELGCEVDVVSFPFGRTVDLPGVRYYRVANPLGFRSVPIGFSLRKLFLDVLLVAKVLERLRSVDYLALHALEEAALPVLMLGRRRGLFVVYDMQSSLPEQLAQFPILRSERAQRLLGRCEAWLLRNVNFVGCSAGLGAHARALAPETPVVEWAFPNAFPESLEVDPTAQQRDLELPGDARVVLYTGSFATYQGLDLLIASIPRVVHAEPRAHFVLVGAGSAREIADVRASLDPACAGQVRLLPRVPRDQIPGLLALADVVVSTRRNSRNTPLKIFDYLAGGATIVATDDPAHRAVLDEQVAVLAPPSPDAFARALVSVLSDRERASRLGAAARAFAQQRIGRAQFVASIGEFLDRARRHSGTKAPTTESGSRND